MKRGPNYIPSYDNRKKLKTDNNRVLPLLKPDQEQCFLNAATTGDMVTFNKLLFKVNLNCTNLCNESALMLAIAHAPYPSKLYMTKRLLDLGVDLDIVSWLGDSAHSLAKKNQAHDIVAILNYKSLLHLGLPSELWVEIAKYLEPEDLNTFRLVCHALSDLHNENQDILWQPLLNRLHALNRTIKVTPPSGKTIREAFIDGFFHIMLQQYNEFEDLRANGFLDLNKARVHFDHSKLTTLNLLEERHKQLVNLNCTIIQKCIDEQPGEILRIEEHVTITRFPEQIFEGNNKAYFANLKVIRVILNPLRSLPENIDVCENLEELHCCQNSLVELPGSLANLKKLRRLCCHNNFLTELPEGLCELDSLSNINAISNNITHLPTNIGALVNLRKLDMASNSISVFPESIIYILDNSIEYEFEGNPVYSSYYSKNSTDGYFVSFISAQKSSPDLTLEKKQLDNDLAFWEPLAEGLRLIHPTFELNTDLQESLRDQFIECFKVIAETQLNMLTSLLDPSLHINYHIIRNALTGDLSFAHLSLDRMIRNHEHIVTMLSATHNESVSEQNTLQNEASQGLFFQLHTAIDNNGLDTNNLLDLEEPDGTIGLKW